MPGSHSQATQADRERLNLNVVFQHMANIAVDGASPDVELSMTRDFKLHIDGISTDRWGYLALIEAHRATYSRRPPLYINQAFADGDFVSARLEPNQLAHFRLVDGLICELWMTVDWQTWCRWLLSHTMT